MFNLTAKQLHKAANIQERIQKLQKQLEQILGGEVTDTTKTGPAPKPERKSGRKKVSAAVRKARSLAMKARWAKAKKAGKAKL